MFPTTIWQMNQTTEIFKSERSRISFAIECNYSFSYNYWVKAKRDGRRD